MASTHRCVVTGRNKDGQSVVVRDEQVETGRLGSADFWRTTKSPASLTDENVSGPYSLEPAPGGTIFRFFEIPPHDPLCHPSKLKELRLKRLQPLERATVVWIPGAIP